MNAKPIRFTTIRLFAACALLAAFIAGTVGALAAQRQSPASQRHAAPKSPTARLITGPFKPIRSVVAGGGGIIFEFRPMYTYDTAAVSSTAPANGTYNTAIYDDSDISGNTVNLTGAAGRVYINLFLSNWSTAGCGGGAPPDCNGLLRIWETYVDAMGYMNGVGTPLTPGVVPCVSSADCVPALGETGSPCGGAVAGQCDHGWIKANRSDSWDNFAPGQEFGECALPIWQVGNLLNAGGQNYFSVLASETDTGFSCGVADPGVTVYGGSFVLDVAVGAAGTYTIGHQADLVLSFDDNPASQGGEQLIPIAELRPAIVNIPVGRCCWDEGNSCLAETSEANCDVLSLGAGSWEEGNEPCPIDGGSECPACQDNGDCNDGDACTLDICTIPPGADFGACSNPDRPDWDQMTQCCNSGTGAICTPAVSNTCETAGCSLAGNHGDCTTTPIADGEPCAGDDNGEGAFDGDANPCTYDDTCTGGMCAGTDITGEMIMCMEDADCLAATGASGASCSEGLCVCSLVPDLTIDIDPSGKADDNCFDSGDEGAKVTATVHVAAATAPINGGQFLITYDPSCLSYNSAVGVGDYDDQVFGPVVNETAGTIFTVVGVGFGGGDGPSGNADMVELSFTKVGECNTCDICFDSNNPQNTYLVDNRGQRVDVNPICSKAIMANNEIDIDVPDNVKRNVDCGNQPVANISWASPTVFDSCGSSTLTCSGESQDGSVFTHEEALNGGQFGVGVTNFCCTAESDWCGKTAEECWTVEVNDQISLDVTVGLSPSAQSKPGDNLTRCIKFTLYDDSGFQQPSYYEADITFGGQFDYIGKSVDKLKIPANNWRCITAWDQLHTLRSCYVVDGSDCVDGVLHAEFAGDPVFGGNWLVSGNLDGYKKAIDGGDPTRDFNIDIGDYGMIAWQWGADYGTGDTPCGTEGPHADIDGDGLVGLTDYAFIQMNFLESAKACCGDDLLPADTTPRTEITVDQLRREGLGELAAGDLNGDGVLNVDDMNLFMQGQRPSVKGDRGIRKNGGTR